MFQCVYPRHSEFWLTAHAHSFFKTLVNHEVTVELKNDISIRGTLKSVDQYLNIKLDDIMVLEDIKYPHLVRCFDFGMDDVGHRGRRSERDKHVETA